MKNVVLLIVVIAGMMLSSCQQTKYPKGIEHVVLIGLDGLSSWGLQASRTPTMDSLMQNGAYSWDTRCIIPSVSTPNWTAMMAGVGPEGTGSVDNSWKNGALSFPYVAMTKEKKFPTIFRIIREQRPDAVMACIHNWNDFTNMYEPELLNLDENYNEDAIVAQKTAEYIKANKPDFMFAYFTDPDHIMHSKGHVSPEYISVVETLDGYINTIVRSVYDAGIADKTLFIIVSDHGGSFLAHGGYTYEEMNTPIIFSGCGAKKNYQIQQQIYRFDLAANVAFAMGLTVPQQWVGRPTPPAFIGFDEPDNIYPSAKVLPTPALTTKQINENFSNGGVWVDAPAELVITPRPDTKGDIRYTTDLTEPTVSSPSYTAPVKLDKPAIVKAKMFNETGESLMVQGQYRLASTKAGNGINYTLYHCPDANSLPTSFAKYKPVSKGIGYEFGFHTPENHTTMPLNEAMLPFKNRIAAVFEGWLQIDADAEYNFNIWSTGASMMYINNELVVNNRTNGHSGNSGTIALTKGKHRIRMEFFHIDQSTGSILHAWYAAPGLPHQLIPAEKLFLEP